MIAPQADRQPRQPDTQAEVAHAIACDPEFNRDAPAYFITNFCVTVDEERPGLVRPIVAKQFVLDYVRILEAARLEPKNVHCEKSRRMVATWISCAYFLWCLQYVRGFSGYFLSAGQDLVDDGGENSTPDSLFGRLRFMHERLPSYVRKPVELAKLRWACDDMGSFIVGGAPKVGKAARGGGYQRMLVDEAAWIEHMDVIHEALDPACRWGKVYQSTVNGPGNTFAWLKKNKPRGWVFHEMDWKDDPDHVVGLRPTRTEEERLRFGEVVSDWFIAVTASLSDESVAQEYRRKYNRSTRAVVFHEYDEDKHKVEPGIAYDPRLPLWVGLDFGHARKTAAVIGQPVGDRELRVLASYEGSHRNARDNALELIAKIRSIAGDLPLEEVQLIPDPSGETDEIGSGRSILSYYTAAGLTSYFLPPLVGPDSVSRGIQVGKVAFRDGRIRVSAKAGELCEALPIYKWPTDRVTGEVLDKRNPVHDMSSHVCDAFRYLYVSVFSIEGVEYAFAEAASGPAKAPKGEAGLLMAARLRSVQGTSLQVEQDDDDDDDGLYGRSTMTLTSSLQGRRF